ncbi:MAG: hypothetical protein E6R09_09855 [Rhodocyclaceae bacterium]|jgi:hypothetical protein|nr:MAG: hypothetical protein E6R09_09855 [Rhodocyclaceae bacterium]
MRWFFLPFIPLLAIVGNVMLLEQVSLIRVLGAVVFNAFVFSLGSLWWCSYFKSGEAKAKGLILSHALLIFSLASFFVLIGAEVTTSGNCSALISSSRPSSFRNQLVGYTQSFGLCRELGLVVVAFGLFLAYPSFRLFTSLRR